ncbi:MAG: 50S ribosomal protein L25 [Treponema sp.]|nr:50S ribosomal protein L25 [Spirochaetia bacterium]MDD7459508.1 50S ribosomal protein L25 [Spirochaetales bacterium]MDY5811018.1 50S ribosomal protein L25 [Treponema sp.]
MERFVINAVTRKETGKKYAKALRAEGKIPAVAYNEKGESTMLEIAAGEFEKAWRSITKTTLVNLKIDGADNTAYIQDVEYDIISDKVLHADFHVVSGTKAVKAKLKIRLNGTPAGVLKGGFMVKHVPEVMLKALPQDMPESVTADVSKLEIGNKFTIADLNLGDKVTVLTAPAAVVVSIAPPKK